MATNLQSGTLTERACAGGYSKSIVCYEGGAQIGNYLRVLSVWGDEYSTARLQPGTGTDYYDTVSVAPGTGACDFASLTAAFRRYAIRLPDAGYSETQASGAYAKTIIRITAVGGAVDFLASPFLSTTEIPAVGFQRATSYQPAALSSQSTVPAVILRRGTILQAGGLSSASEISVVTVRRACTLRPAALTSTSAMPAFMIARPALIQAATLRTVSTIPVCSGIGVRPAPPGSSTPEPSVHGASVSFKDFTLGWAELHRFAGVNEQPTAIPSMTFDVSGMSVVAWTGGQYVGPCIPGIGTADLATAWETSENGTGGNYVF